MIYHENHLKWNFQESKTDMKQMKCYKRDLASKPLSNYYNFFKIFSFIILIAFNFHLPVVCQIS